MIRFCYLGHGFFRSEHDLDNFWGCKSDTFFSFRNKTGAKQTIHMKIILFSLTENNINKVTMLSAAIFAYHNMGTVNRKKSMLRGK